MSNSYAAMAFYSIYFEFIINKVYHISNSSGMHMKADKKYNPKIFRCATNNISSYCVIYMYI